MQPGVVKALQRVGIYTWILTEPDLSVEVSVFDTGKEGFLYLSAEIEMTRIENLF